MSLPMDLTFRLLGTRSANNLRLMAQSMRKKASCDWSAVREGSGTILSRMHVGRRGYVPVVNTSIAGARVKLGVLEMGRHNPL